MWGKVSIIFGLLVPVALVFVFHGIVNTSYARMEGVVSVLAFLAAIYIGIAEYYYFKSERFYLWVQRQILRWRPVHTYWRFTVRYDGINALIVDGRSRIPELQR